MNISSSKAPWYRQFDVLGWFLMFCMAITLFGMQMAIGWANDIIREYELKRRVVQYEHPIAHAVEIAETKKGKK